LEDQKSIGLWFCVEDNPIIQDFLLDQELKSLQEEKTFQESESENDDEPPLKRAVISRDHVMYNAFTLGVKLL